MKKEPQEPVADSIVKGTGELRVFFLPLEPIERLQRTRTLPDYKRAYSSAQDALHRLWAATEAAQAGYNSKSPGIDIFLSKIRSRVTSISDSQELHSTISDALNAGRTGIFHDIADAQAAARKRRTVVYGSKVISGTGFSDFNFFRGQLAYLWVRYGFWLMRDEVIASMVTTLTIKRLGCNRQTINRAVKELDLYRRKPPPITGVGPGGKFILSDDFRLEIGQLQP